MSDYADVRSPAVTVVIPTRNRSTLLGRTLAAAQRQEGVQLDIVVVDDASTDATRDELPGADRTSVRWIHHDDPQGVSAARNTGIAAARYRWIAFLDDDDLWAPNKLLLQSKSAEAANADFVCCGAVKIDPRLRPIDTHLPPPADHLLQELLKVNAVPGGGSGVLASTDAIRAAGSFDPNLSVLADWDMWIRLAQRARGAVLSEILVANLLHSGNMVVGGYRRSLQTEFDYLTAKHAELLALHGVTLDRKRMSSWSRIERRRVTRLRAEEQRSRRKLLRSALTYFASAGPARHPGALLWGLLSLFGEPGMRAGRRLQERFRPPPSLPPSPRWLHS